MRPSVRAPPLLDAEAMLLVDDRDRELLELDPLLDQRVRTDHDLRSFDVRLDRPGQQRDLDAELLAQRFDGEKVLLSEGFRGCHERTTPSRLDRSQEGVERHDGLARAHVALEEPLHRSRPRQVGIDLRDRLLLIRRQLEWQEPAVARRQLARLAELGRDRRLAFRAGAREPDLEHEQLVEGETPPALLALLLRARLVQRDERVRAQWQPLAHFQRRRQCVGQVARERQCPVDQRPQPLGRHLLARRVDRREVGGGRDPVQVVGADGKLVPP